MRCSGRLHAVRPAAAIDALMSLRKSRRSTRSSAEAWRGNSRCRNSPRPGSCASSSSERHVSRCGVSLMRARKVVRSSFFIALSVMTRRTVRLRLDVIVLDQLTAHGQLALRLPGHVEYFVARPQELLRLAMALQAPFHAQWRGLPRQRHLINAAVARHASHSLPDMDAVVELNEIR